MEQEFKTDESNDKPLISLNRSTGSLYFKGRSLPEDAYAFYKPVLDWLTEYSASPAAETTLIIDLEYFNTASAKQIFKTVSIVCEMAKSHKTCIKWHYDEGDRDMFASGERFSKLCGMPFELVQNH